MDSPNLKGIKDRLDGIRKILMAHHEAGKSLPTASKGAERETLIRDFLERVLPLPYRFGTGAIIDANGSSSGHLDVVVEFPFLPSFPTLGATERLYLADSCAFVVEIKSDLTAQWPQMKEKAKQVLQLRRSWHSHEAENLLRQSEKATTGRTARSATDSLKASSARPSCRWSEFKHDVATQQPS